MDDAYRDAAALLQYPVPAASADTQIGQVVAVGVPVGQHSPFARRVSRQCRPLGRCLYSADTAATAHSVNPRKLLILLVSRQGLEPQTRRLRDSCRSRRSGRFGCWATSRRARTTRRGASFRRPITVDGERSLWPRVPEGEPSAKLNDEITLVVRPAVRWRPDGRTGRLVKGTWPRRGPRRSLRLMESDG